MLLQRSRQRSLRLIGVAIVACFLGFLIISRHNHNAQNHILQPRKLQEISQSPITAHITLTDYQSTSICSAHGFDVFPVQKDKRKVYDLFLFSNEMDWLEIRLHTLANYVDYFVIVESDKTFTGIPKPLVLRENWDKFAAFHSKIIYRVVPDPGSSVGPRTWDHEDYMRNALFDKVFPDLEETPQQPNFGDVLLVSDVDEIPKPDAMAVLRYCDFPDRLTLRSHFYYYSFQWLHRGPEWAHPQVTTYRGLDDTISPKDLRNGEGHVGFLWLGLIGTWWAKAELWDAAWHCSSCFATLAEMRKKMESFSHTGWNTESNKQTANLLERVRKGLDLFGRETEKYDRIDNNQDVPAYILTNGRKFGFLLNRDGENAGFVDYPSEGQS